MIENSAYLFLGEDDYRKDLSIEKIKNKLSMPSGSVDCRIYHSKGINISEIISDLMTNPFLSGRKLIILKDAQNLAPPDEDILLSYLKQPSAKTIFIICSHNKIGLKNSFFSRAAEYAKIIDFSPLDEKDILSWIKEQCKIRKKTINNAAARFLKENTACDLNLLSESIEVLSLYAGSRLDITEEDARRLISESAGISTFRLIDEITSRDKESALKALLMIDQAGKSPYEILGLLAWHIRRLGKVKALLEDRAASENTIAKSLKLSPYIARKIINQARQFTFKEIKKAQQLINETDMRLKKSIANPQSLLEALVVDMALG